MPYSTPIKSMHIACILYCRFCRHCKVTNSVQSHRFDARQRCSFTTLTHCSTTHFSAKMLFTTLIALLDVTRVAPLRTTASTNHRASWWECRTANPRS